MDLTYSNLDKLLELFSSSEEENSNDLYDETNQEIKEADESEDVLKCDNNNESTFSQILKESTGVMHSVNHEEIKVVKLEVKPITITDSDSDSEELSEIGKSNDLMERCDSMVAIEEIENSESFKIGKRKKVIKESSKKLLNNKNYEMCDNKNACKPFRPRKNRMQVKRNLKCIECNQRMKNEQYFMLHMQIHDGHKETECLICKIDFENVDKVLEHYASFDKNKKDPHYIKLRPFPCDHCDLRYKNRKHLTDHLDIHCGEGKYLCPVCGKRFFKGFNLTIHLKVHEKSYDSCERCHKNFRNVREYQAHQRNVHGENNIKCPICNRAFSRRNNMKKHMETHGRVYNQCMLCNKNFEHRRDFNQHMREVHNRIKKYACSICGKIFLLHCKLTRHLETHNRIKDNCSLCDKDFRNRRDYNAHIKNVHQGKPDVTKQDERIEPSCKVKFKISHDVQINESSDANYGILNDDVKINIKIDMMNDENKNFDGYFI